jgi:LuxR family maltose regulon positive regulatory protein
MHGTALLERLLTAAEAGGRSGSAVEILVLLALAHRAANDVAGALATLDRAVAIAAPERFVRVFVDEGAPMTSLLQKTAKRGGAHGYTHKLLAATGQETLSARPQPGLVEPLSERELDVLQLLASDLDGPGIARELYVSLNTMRSHTKSIFTKLGVNSRREAVRRATELELLSRTSRDR